MPSARPETEANPILRIWQQQGYGIAVLRKGSAVNADIIIPEVMGQYKGWSSAVNMLACEVLNRDANCQWIVTAGDDTYPDPNLSAELIANQLFAHFGGTFGVMQPTGDRWYPNHPLGGCSIDHIAGSPWMGREWCLRAHGGRGPLWPEFYHNFADQMLQDISSKLGAFWQRLDIVHYHDHVSRRTPSLWKGHQPDWHAESHGSSYHRDKIVYDRLAADGFRAALDLL